MSDASWAGDEGAVNAPSSRPPLGQVLLAGLPGPVIGVPRRTGQPVAQQVIAEQLGPAGVGVATQTACQANCYKVMLLTGRKDPAVHRFYEGAGFRGGEKAGYIARPTS